MVADEGGVLDHEPDPENWDCKSCGDPWPCEPAKKVMVETMSPTELRINQWTDFERAVTSHRVQGLNAQELWDRFFGWTTPEKIV